MSDDGLQQAQSKMRTAGVATEAIDVFSHYYRELESGATGMIAEGSIDPVDTPPLIDDADFSVDQQRDAFAETVIIKLNGGLGTSMGMDKAKSLLPVRDGQSFLDLIVQQVQAARRRYDVTLPLVLMDSFRTREDTLAALARYDDLGVDGLDLDFLQNQEPKLLASDLTPVEWPADPSLEWCPPGHGDLYTALSASGILARMLEQGYRYASVSNSDNLGAAPNAKIAAWFADSKAPYAAELCRRTPADLKGGHLAIRKSDGRLIQRETAQTPKEDMQYFTDESRHPYFHTNNLWFDLEVLAATLQEKHSVLGLPLIRNEKTVDPSDPSSPAVIQLESAMGAAVAVFPGALALGVGRDRFLPVKTTNDLLLLRSDVYDVAEDGSLTQVADPVPLVSLDSDYYKTIDAFEQRFGAGAPSLKKASSLTVKGDWTFEADVVVEGAGELEDQGSPQVVAARAVISG